jgi:NCAIR mutase (PurE)-related protein
MSVPAWLQTLLTEVATQRIGVPEALERLRGWPVDPVPGPHGETVARLDTQREMRHGFPEVILAQGKRFDHLQRILQRALENPSDLLVTRVSPKRRLRLRQQFPDLQERGGCLYRTAMTGDRQGMVAVLSAGTSDFDVAEEAALSAWMLGAHVVTHYDAGVAGLHRLLAARELLREARVFVVVAGMEGALPTVVGGLVDRPVIAVPTSQGYGASFHGVSALLGMLNSCAANVSVVNIDNGFGAGYIAGLINRQVPG